MSRYQPQHWTTADEVAFIGALGRDAFEAYAAIVQTGCREYGEGVDREAVLKAIGWRQAVYKATDELKCKEGESVERQGGNDRQGVMTLSDPNLVGARPGRTPRPPADPARNEVE